MMAGTETLDLSGVPETMLWPLWNRAAHQELDKRLLEDPLSSKLVSRINYDFRGTFGKPHVFHAIRARLGDDLVRDYVSRCESQPVVVSLGSGLETQPWRVDDERIQWINVDVAEAVAVQKRILPGHPRLNLVSSSALDVGWLDAVPKACAPFVSASGLLMYFREQDVIRILATIVDRWPSATIFFDTIPPFFSRKTMKGLKVTKKYTAPPMPWGISVDDVAGFLENIPGIQPERIMTYAEPYPEWTRFYKLLSKIAPIRRRLAVGLVVARGERKTANHYVG